MAAKAVKTTDDDFAERVRIHLEAKHDQLTQQERIAYNIVMASANNPFNIKSAPHVTGDSDHARNHNDNNNSDFNCDSNATTLPLRYNNDNCDNGHDPAYESDSGDDHDYDNHYDRDSYGKAYDSDDDVYDGDESKERDQGERLTLSDSTRAVHAGLI
eukprot:g5343.t1